MLTACQRKRMSYRVVIGKPLFLLKKCVLAFSPQPQAPSVRFPFVAGRFRNLHQTSGEQAPLPTTAGSAGGLHGCTAVCTLHPLLRGQLRYRWTHSASIRDSHLDNRSHLQMTPSGRKLLLCPPTSAA